MKAATTLTSFDFGAAVYQGGGIECRVQNKECRRQKFREKLRRGGIRSLLKHEKDTHQFGLVFDGQGIGVRLGCVCVIGVTTSLLPFSRVCVTTMLVCVVLFGVTTNLV